MKNSFQEYVSQLQNYLLNTEAHGKDFQPILLLEALNQAYNILLKTHKRAGQIFIIGNGGSAAIASHMAIDLWKNGGIRATAFNDASLLTCISNDFGYESVFEKPVDFFAQPEDTLIAISSSGKSQNILRAVDRACAKNCSVITFSGFHPDNPLRRKGHVNFYVASESYGFVEISHLTLGHYLADCVMMKNKMNAAQTQTAGKK